MRANIPPKHPVQTYIGSKRRGCYPCLHCVNCQFMIKGDKFIHPISGALSEIRQFLTCDFAVYVLTCPCGLLYVGETTCDMNTRLNNHTFTIRRKRRDLPVPKHLTEAGHKEKDLRFMILDQVQMPRRGGDRTLTLKKRELYWIYRLQTLRPVGLNVEFSVVSYRHPFDLGGWYAHLIPLGTSPGTSPDT